MKYCAAFTPTQALDQLQQAFNDVQHTLCALKLFLNTSKGKCIFSKAKSKSANHPSVSSFQGSEIKLVSHDRYLGILVEDALSFVPCVQQLT